ncbi:hypothetical protein K435DRAFT_671813 [Dendrothele bispora CBS 962.96]|uniref:Uncharacterized protein n=1 Tax=Dendrothele bispora (strain CBS 962.96) TaxID=1314807 RepID=A0A4S8LT09_DENBC|nr:hypothetical protein K435DRAFT_671813 [Dendrothele bispora CBS 962.96]
MPPLLDDDNLSLRADDELEEVDEVGALDDSEQEEYISASADARTALKKIRGFSFSVINSPTIGLPEWQRACQRHGLASRVLPDDVKTRWNSTYDMLDFAVKYRKAVDDVTSNKDLEYRKHELTSKEWLILGDLLRVLKVGDYLSFPDHYLIIL